ncbi:hypothetical protein [Luteimonas suaedae]|uniref:hypothetical protein n=1 Tax=Luteimonas suaedae TaxID=2605430 RepID=UPI0011EFA823|nr:hypothetical protein [Luteimonas suaedae]
MKTILFLACLALLVAPGTTAQARPLPESAPAARAAVAEADSAVLQGDVARALRALSAVPADAFRGPDRDQRACMLGRFDRRAPPYLAAAVDDPLVRDVLAAYQTYWWRALTAPVKRAELERALSRELRALLASADVETAGDDLDALEQPLSAALAQRGYHAVLGRTPPLRELMLWRRQDERAFEVDLPEGQQRVRVDLLDDFAALGWSAYGRCDYGSNGGWATAEKLFAVVPVYREGLDSEKFRVVFLGHEAQHFADQNRFPDLQPWELEYRAKLVELSMAETVSEKRLRGFMTAQSDDTDSPHTYANKRVVADLRTKLDADPDAVPLTRLQSAAHELLLEDSARREAAAMSRPAPDAPHR